MMTHYDEGHYAAKHPKGSIPHPQITEKIRAKLTDGKLSCAAAHAVAQEFGITPAEVGKTLDLIEARINKCQLGLFGYQPQKRIVEPAESVSSELRQVIEEALHEGKISCAAIWEIAQKEHMTRLEVSSACEALQIKISSCQLGTFGSK